MKNIKAITISNDGALKRLAITYDEIDDNGRVTRSNVKTMRTITNSKIANQLTDIEQFTSELIAEE